MIRVGIDDAAPVHGNEAAAEATLVDRSQPLERAALALPGLHARTVARLLRLDDRTEQRAGLAEELQAFARERLEPYKAPRTVRFLDALPRTHLGKVDRGQLRRQ